MTSKEIISVVTAYEEGKSIECRPLTNPNWTDVWDPSWNFDKFEYRVKTQPKLIPFDLNDDLINKEVYSNEYFIKGIITAQTSGYIHLGGNVYSYLTLYNKFKFKDGKPCGKHE